MLDQPAALLSIHDVMPETLSGVEELFSLVVDSGLGPPALLVVPGKNWSSAEVDRLRAWEAAGAELIAHGWLHHTQPRRAFHRLHAAVLSRNVAEHLALDPEDVVALMQRSYDWFEIHGLAPPRTYIPPAWALGLARDRLHELPYARVEVLRGVLHVAARVELATLPLVGFEADTPLRARVLSWWNRRAERRARQMGLPLRISLHPRDHRLLLGDELQRCLGAGWRPLRYAELIAPAPP
ncbi:MAG: DUF2334 domain-containing protein [Halieaceae bacterium]|jgi:predicted deacetylase|nr:DUF2334 domain-containing protein [Halieaceae bacterium]